MKDHSKSLSCSPKRKKLNKGKEIVYDLGTIGMVKVIVVGFARGGLSNNALRGIYEL